MDLECLFVGNHFGFHVWWLGRWAQINVTSAGAAGRYRDDQSHDNKLTKNKVRLGQKYKHDYTVE